MSEDPDRTVTANRTLPLWAAVLLAAAAGPVMDAGFPALSWWPLTFVGIAMLLVSLIGRRPGEPFWWAWSAGSPTTSCRSTGPACFSARSRCRRSRPSSR
ncbi:MAG: hypothetical protein WDM88_08825 [Galbitalea sp.]